MSKNDKDSDTLMNSLKKEFDDKIWIGIDKKEHEVNINDMYKCRSQACIGLIQTIKVLDYVYQVNKTIELSPNTLNNFKDIYNNQIVRLITSTEVFSY